MDGNQRPTWTNLPEINESDGEMAATLASKFFGEPLEWQRHVLHALLARDGKDKYQFHSIALTVPRQNGKSWDVLARCLYGLVADDERILYTCQHGDTSDEMFRRLSEVFEDEDNEELSKQFCKSVRKTNGQQAIYLNGGGYIRFTTRTNSLARGKSYDVLIYDEAQELTESQQAASLFAISASRKHNTQTIYIGTPPDPSSVGDVFTRLHDQAHAEDTEAIPWMEWGVSEIGDVYDRDRWHRVNPSLGILIDETAVEGELTTSKDTFARERLGWWSAYVKYQAAIPAKEWQDAEISEIGNNYPDKTALAVKFSLDGSHYTLAGCKSRKRNAAVELIEVGSTENGTKSLAEELYKRRSKVSCVVIDGFSGADALCDNLVELKVPKGYIVRPSAGQVSAAATCFVDALRDGSLKHTKQSQLEDSAVNAVKRPIGQKGGWGFDCSEPHDPTPIEAASLALWGLRNTKRDPKRKQRFL